MAQLELAVQLLERAKFHADPFALRDRDLEWAYELNLITAQADAELCKACLTLGIPEPVAALIPAATVRNDLAGQSRASFVSLVRLRLWIRRRRRRALELIKLNTARGGEQGPYR